MPTTNLRNLLYRAALPLAPSPRGQMTHQAAGHAIDLKAYEAILRRHHVLGASLLLTGGGQSASVHTSVVKPAHHAGDTTLYRVASITKMATALVILMLAEDGAFALDDPIAPLMPDCRDLPALQGVTLRQLLCHTSGLRDVPAYEAALRNGQDLRAVLSADGVRGSNAMVYSNLGFGLLGCLMEAVTGQCLEDIFQQRLFRPLGMQATLNASALDEGRIMPISRVLPYKPGQDVSITPLGRQPLTAPDPLHHFGHTAGAMYTDCPSLAKLLALIAYQGTHEGTQLLRPESIRQMTAQHSFSGPASAPTRRYGLGLVILDRPDIAPGLLYGHQGFAYGCVDGAFFQADTGRQMIFLNGGCSEARQGRLGLCNRDLLRWAFTQEVPAWT